MGNHFGDTVERAPLDELSPRPTPGISLRCFAFFARVYPQFFSPFVPMRDL